MARCFDGLMLRFLDASMPRYPNDSMPRCRDAGRDGSYIDTATVLKTVNDPLDRKEHARADGNLDVTAFSDG